MSYTKIDPADLDSPCRELSIHGLGFVVAIFGSLVNYVFVCAYWGSNLAVYLLLLALLRTSLNLLMKWYIWGINIPTWTILPIIDINSLKFVYFANKTIFIGFVQTMYVFVFCKKH